MTCLWTLSLWTLKEQGVRFTYQPSVKTFFWVDEKFYAANKEEILEWAERYNCEVPSKTYGWVEVPDENVALLFRMMWS